MPLKVSGTPAAGQGSRVDNRVAVGSLHFAAECLEHLNRDVDIANGRTVADRRRAVAEKRGDQVFGHSVLRPFHGDITGQWADRFYDPGLGQLG